jgi:hypothetical protein
MEALTDRRQAPRSRIRICGRGVGFEPTIPQLRDNFPSGPLPARFCHAVVMHTPFRRVNRWSRSDVTL